MPFKSLFFATTNQRKIRESLLACDSFNIKIKPIKLDIIEIQSRDPLEILKAKINSAFLLTQKPVVVTDTSWKIPALNGFPGGYMKDVADWFSADDFLALIANKKDKRISFTESIAYQDSKQLKIFTQEYWGVFADKPKGSGVSIEQVAEFNGFTIGEKRDQGKTSHDPKDYIWFQFAKWFSEK